MILSFDKVQYLRIKIKVLINMPSKNRKLGMYEPKIDLVIRFVMIG